ncbi:MAG TPA: ThiF family adenylyltransferase [Pseudolabrys sp.]|nr:ThiF family adenylyltransferase [Pseudolabrys sp.]
MWYLADTARVAFEEAALRSLAAAQTWFSTERPRFDEAMQFCVDAEIMLPARNYPITLVYPRNFPDTPIVVMPRTPERWSDHQWGRRELCLEWGPDNWVPDISGADMVESAHRLLRDETPSEDGARPAPVPSRHVDSIGQLLRNDGWGFVQTLALTRTLAERSGPLLLPMHFAVRSRDATLTVIPRSIAEEGTAGWHDPTVPAGIKADSISHIGYVAILPEGVAPPIERSAAGFRRELAEAGIVVQEDAERGFSLCLVWAESDAHLFWVADKTDKVFTFKQLVEGSAARLDATHAGFKSRSAAIIGCGSAGSKIAACLARSGVGKFILVDDDVLLPENLVRNDLDWRVVGEHKVEGVKQRIAMIAPGAECIVRVRQLAGQESGSAADELMTLISACDVIIDATADTRVFNLLASVAARASKPLVWLEVFGGGIGGLVARSRPGLDPSPLIARARINGWCVARNKPAPKAIGGYGAEGAEGTMIADDMDVTIIAAHAAHLVTDILAHPEQSAFPVSAYFIGLKTGWLFEQPFHSFPVDLGGPEAAVLAIPNAEGLATIRHMLDEVNDRKSAA